MVSRSNEHPLLEPLLARWTARASCPLTTTRRHAPHPELFQSFRALLSRPTTASAAMSKSIFADLPLFIPRDQLPSLLILVPALVIAFPILAIGLNVAYQLVSRSPALLATSLRTSLRASAS